jgi:hypothetical protein
MPVNVCHLASSWSIRRKRRARVASRFAQGAQRLGPHAVQRRNLGFGFLAGVRQANDASAARRAA